MLHFILRRLGEAAVIIFLVSLFCFFILYLIPGDPVLALYGGDLTPEKYQEYFKEMGLDKPLYERYFDWIGNFVQGEYGNSVKYNLPVKELIRDRLPVTLYMGFISLIISTVVGILFGILSSIKRGSWSDNVITVAANIGSAVPLFWLGVVGVYIFSVELKWLPSFGFDFPWKGDAVLSIKQSILPVIALSTALLASTTRQLRSSMLEVIRLDFIRSARAKGLSENHVIYHHALPNAIIPVVTLIGLHFRQLVAGAVSVEKVFNIAGMGNLLVTAVFSRDVAVTQATVMIIAIVIVLANLVVDISYGYIDPRIRIQ